MLLALLYEIADTIYMTLQLLDLEELGLESSQSGDGITGEAASETLNVLSLLENHCQRLLGLEHELGLKVDFSKPVHEREGITYKEFPHWDNFIKDKPSESFKRYFEEVKAALVSSINRVPNFWRSQTFGQFLERRDYEGISKVAKRLIHSAL